MSVTVAVTTRQGSTMGTVIAKVSDPALQVREVNFYVRVPNRDAAWLGPYPPDILRRPQPGVYEKDIVLDSQFNTEVATDVILDDGTLAKPRDVQTFGLRTAAGGTGDVRVQDADTAAVAATTLAFQGAVVSVANGVATFNLDGRYAQAGHNHDGTYLKLSGGTLTGTLNTPALNVGGTATLSAAAGTVTMVNVQPTVAWGVEAASQTLFSGFHSNELANWHRRGGTITVAATGATVQAGRENAVVDPVVGGDGGPSIIATQAGATVVYEFTGLEINRRSRLAYRAYVQFRVAGNGPTHVRVELLLGGTWTEVQADAAPVWRQGLWNQQFSYGNFAVTGVRFTLTFNAGTAYLRELGVASANTPLGVQTFAPLYQPAEFSSLTVTTAQSFGSRLGQHINLWGTSYGLGMQAACLYFRTAFDASFRWYAGGAHSSTDGIPGLGGVQAMALDSSGHLTTRMGISAGGNVSSGGYVQGNGYFLGAGSSYLNLTNTAASFLTSSGAALPGRFGNLLVSDSYGDTGYVPADGIAARGYLRSFGPGGGVFLDNRAGSGGGGHPWIIHNSADVMRWWSTAFNVDRMTLSQHGELGVTVSVRTGEFWASGWYRSTVANVGMYNESLGTHFYAASDGYAAVWNTTGSGICLRTGHAAGLTNAVGWLHQDGTSIGLLHSGRGWAVRAWNGGVELYGNVFAPGATRIGQHPTYGAGYAAFWRNGADYSLLADGSATFVNAASNVYIRRGNDNRITVGEVIRMHVDTRFDGPISDQYGHEVPGVVVSAAAPDNALNPARQGSLWLQV